MNQPSINFDHVQCSLSEKITTWIKEHVCCWVAFFAGLMVGFNF